jgi:hypothetical protein
VFCVVLGAGSRPRNAHAAMHAARVAPLRRAADWGCARPRTLRTWGPGSTFTGPSALTRSARELRCVRARPRRGGRGGAACRGADDPAGERHRGAAGCPGAAGGECARPHAQRHVFTARGTPQRGGPSGSDPGSAGIPCTRSRRGGRLPFTIG